MNNRKFFPWFKGALGAIDGTHIRVRASAEARAAHRNRKGELTQNMLAACTFSMLFCYVLAGMEGSAADSQLFDIARENRCVPMLSTVELELIHTNSLPIPDGFFLLADAGFPSCNALLTPYRGTRYHLREWAQGNQR